MPPADIPLGALVPNDYNPRRTIDDDRLADLAASIEQIGLISPLAVRPLAGDADDAADGLLEDALETVTGRDGATYEVVAGTRRLHALRQIHEEDHEVPCRVLKLTDDQAELLALAENLDRDDLTPTEEAEAFAKRVFVTVDKATAEALKVEAGAEIRMAGNNYTVAFRALVEGLESNVTPRGVPLPMPSRKGRSVREVAEGVPSRTPQEIARRVRLYALPEDVWTLVDDGELPLRQAEIIAGIAGVEAPWNERVQAMVELAKQCVEEAWSKTDCREETQARRGAMGKKDETALAPAKASAGEGQETLEELLCRVAALVDDVEEPEGEPTAREVEEARAAVERRLAELDGEIEELEERAAWLDALAGRLEVGMEARFRGTLDGFDSRRMYCSYCGQGVTKEKIGEVARVVGERYKGFEGDRDELGKEQGKLVDLLERLEERRGPG